LLGDQFLDFSHLPLSGGCDQLVHPVTPRHNAFFAQLKQSQGEPAVNRGQFQRKRLVKGAVTR
jgi:hypothetical protein